MRFFSSLFYFTVFVQNVLSMSLPPFATVQSSVAMHSNLTRSVQFLHFPLGSKKQKQKKKKKS